MDGNEYAGIMLKRMDARLPALPVIAVSLVVFGLAMVFSENSLPVNSITEVILDIKRMKERNRMKARQGRKQNKDIGHAEQSQSYGGMGGMSGY